MQRRILVNGSVVRSSGFLRCATYTVALLLGCSESTTAVGTGTTNVANLDASSVTSEANLAVDVPIPGVSQDWVAEFNRCDPLFDVVLREADGLGPLYTRQACPSCHDGALRGAGFVQKMSVVQADGITPDPDQSELPFGRTVHPFTAAGATTPILAPFDSNVRVSTPLGPPVLGRGYLEAVLDDQIVAAAAAQASATGNIHGRVNNVVYASQPNTDTRFHDHQTGDTVIGRLGVKARIATLDDFAADALQGDIGITSPLRRARFQIPMANLMTISPVSTPRSTMSTTAPTTRACLQSHRATCHLATDNRCSRRFNVRRATCRHCIHDPIIRSKSSPTSTHRSTPIC